MSKELTEEQLLRENDYFYNTTQLTMNTQTLEFYPAFLDSVTGHVYLSRFANGELAPVHLLSGLPDGLVERRSSTNDVYAVSETVVSGFACKGAFYSRADVMALSDECH